jgi:hypothetical protein
MKTIILVTLLFLFPGLSWGQSLTGLWTGILTHDSTTIRKEHSYEIALTEYKGKVYGYSRSEFIVNDTLYYIVKRVKGTISGDSCEVVDDEIIAYNFRGKLDKGVKVVNTFRLNRADSTWKLDGRWKTNQTKKFYSISGNTDLQAENNFNASKLFPHLEELKKADDVAFYKEKKKQDEKNRQLLTAVKKDPVKAEQKNKSATPVVQPADIAKSATSTPIEITSPAVADNKQKNESAMQSAAFKQDSETLAPAQSNPAISTDKQQTALQTGSGDIDIRMTGLITTDRIYKEQKSKSVPAKEPEIKPAFSKAPGIKETTATQTKDEPRINIDTSDHIIVQSQQPEVTKKILSAPVAKSANPPGSADDQKINVPAAMNTPDIKIPAAGAAALHAAKRMSVYSNTLSVKSDSLVLALYDNGEIDGDVVSVLLNGEVIIARQELKAAAFKKTIYIRPEDGDTFELVLYAENLGKYPPNTGLLIIYDGDTPHYLRFSADLQTNAAVVLKKERK